MNKILVFSASWCSPCKTHKNNMTNNNIPFEEVDVDENDNLVGKYNIRSVPTTIVVNESGDVVLKSDGSPLRYSGTMSNIKELLDYVSE